MTSTIIAVADPGIVYDPGIASSNLEGGAVWGLTSAMKSEITFNEGATVETNFDGYDVVHLWETARQVEVHLIAGGGEKIGGLGKVGPVGCRHRRLLKRGPSFGLRLAIRFPSSSGTAKHLAIGAGGYKRNGANSP